MNPRYEAAATYLQALEETLVAGWNAVYERGPATPYHRLALLHPDHLVEIDLPEHLSQTTVQRQMQGPRTFPKAIWTVDCQSALLWGYPCKLSGELHQDHLFPYSLGGPTVGTNRIYLCRYHNMVKTCDIHCFPWEASEQWLDPWVEEQVEKLRVQVFSLYG